MTESDQAVRLNGWAQWTLRGLLELGGAASPRELEQHVARRLQEVLTPGKIARVIKNNYLRWGAHELRKNGLLAGEYGTWELTTAGRELALRRAGERIDLPTDIEELPPEQANYNGPTESVLVTSFDGFRIPVLRALQAGPMQKQDLLAAVERSIGTSLLPGDRRVMPNGHRVWSFRTSWSLTSMKKDGLLANDGKAVWALTETGRAHLQQEDGSWSIGAFQQSRATVRVAGSGTTVPPPSPPRRSGRPRLGARSATLCRTQRDSGGVYRVRWRGESTGDCNAIPFARTPSLQLNHPEFYTGGSYPGCYRPGTQAQFGVPAVQADAVAVERATVEVTSGNSTNGVIFVHNNAGTLRFSEFAVAPAASSMEFTFTNTQLDAAMRPGLVNITGASTTYSQREPALVQIPSSLETLLVYVDSSGTLRQSSKQIGASQLWEAPALSFTNTASSIASTRSVSMVSVGNEVWMASPTASTIRLYRLTGPNSPPAVSRTWELMATLNYTTQHRPNLAAVRDLVDPSQTRLVLLYTSFGDYQYAQSPAGTSAAAWTATAGWTSGPFETFGDPTLRQPSAGAAVWDDRPIVTTAPASGHPNWPDLRSTLEFGQVCTATAQCTSLSASATCNTTTEFCELNGDPYVRTDFAPFTRGPAIGNYADYDDWRIIPWRTCEYFRTQPLLPGAPTPYCGPIPRWDEPFGAAFGTTPPLNDASVNAHLYSSQLACQPPQPCSTL